MAFLIPHHARAVGHDEIAEELWDGAPPPAWPASVKSLASRSRAALSSIHDAETALAGGEPAAAAGHVFVARLISARPGTT